MGSSCDAHWQVNLIRVLGVAPKAVRDAVPGPARLAPAIKVVTEGLTNVKVHRGTDSTLNHVIMTQCFVEHGHVDIMLKKNDHCLMHHSEPTNH